MRSATVERGCFLVSTLVPMYVSLDIVDCCCWLLVVGTTSIGIHVLVYTEYRY